MRVITTVTLLLVLTYCIDGQGQRRGRGGRRRDRGDDIIAVDPVLDVGQPAVVTGVGLGTVAVPGISTGLTGGVGVIPGSFVDTGVVGRGVLDGGVFVTPRFGFDRFNRPGRFFGRRRRPACRGVIRRSSCFRRGQFGGRFRGRRRFCRSDVNCPTRRVCCFDGCNRVCVRPFF